MLLQQLLTFYSGRSRYHRLLSIKHWIKKPTYYDYSFIERSKDLEEPERKLKIVFKNFFVEESDTGDFYTASSYPSGTRPLVPVLIQIINNLLTDLIDLRPRVANYDPSVIFIFSIYSFL